MTTVYPISSATPQASASTSASGGDNQINEDTFLKLLVAQIQYQDPLSPTDPTTFLTQTAQFTQVQMLSNIETAQKASQESGQLLAASAMIGRSATYSLATSGQSGTPTPTTTVNIAGTLPKDATAGATATTQTDVFTSSGEKIPITLTFTRTTKGWNAQASSGGRSLGDPLPLTFDANGALTSGNVSIPASALNGVVGTTGDWPATGITLDFGAATDPTRLQLSSGPTTVAVMEQNGNDGQTATGVVTGVHITADGPMLVIDGKEIPYASVTDLQA